MIPVEAITLIVGLGLSQEQAKAVAEGFRLVEIATKEDCERPLEERRRRDRERKRLLGIPRNSEEGVEFHASRTRAFSLAKSLDNPHPNAAHSSAPKGAERARRLPDDWQPNEIHRKRAGALGISTDWLAEILEEFRNFWLSEGGVKSRKLNWDLTFTNRIIDQAKRGRKGRPPPNVLPLTRNAKPSVHDALKDFQDELHGDGNLPGASGESVCGNSPRLLPARGG